MLKLTPTRPRPERLRVALLCSRRAPGLAYLLDHDRNRGSLYELVATITSDPACGELGRLTRERVPQVTHDLAAFYADRRARQSNLDVREEYDQITVTLLRPFRPDLVILCGYLHIVTRPLLDAYPRRLINIHDGDLLLVGTDRPTYRGLRSVRDAVFAGEPETRTSVHFVTADVDLGPVLLRSWPFPTHPMIRQAAGWNADHILKAYAYAHREWMMEASWGPLLAKTIELVAGDRVRVLDGRAVVDGLLGPAELAADEVEHGRHAQAARPEVGGG